jgi:hypothetical protein
VTGTGARKGLLFLAILQHAEAGLAVSTRYRASPPRGGSAEAVGALPISPPRGMKGFMKCTLMAPLPKWGPWPRWVPTRPKAYPGDLEGSRV